MVTITTTTFAWQAGRQSVSSSHKIAQSAHEAGDELKATTKKYLARQRQQQQQHTIAEATTK